jgi:hypothetical protein
VLGIFVVPETLDALTGISFFDQPWPGDLRRENGRPRLAGYPNPRNSATVTEELAALDGLDGFSPVAAGYVRFTGALDPASLPSTPNAALQPLSAVQLVNIDPASSERGARWPLSLSLIEGAGVYWQPHTLAFMPAIGFPLRAGTRYALVVTDAARGLLGPTAPSPDLAAILSDAGLADGALARARAALAPALAELTNQGFPAERLVQLSVFTTADPGAELRALRTATRASSPPTFRAARWLFDGGTTGFSEYLGEYGPSPDYQHGTAPYLQVDAGGGFVFDGGVPLVASTNDLRFSLSIPDATGCPQPAGGYPLVLYGHGAAGHYRSAVTDGTAAALTQRCLAVMGIDRPLHGTRAGAASGADPALTSSNLTNPASWRSTPRQAVVDEIQRIRLFTESAAEIPASVSATGAAIRFDASRLIYFGHDLGGSSGGLLLGIEPLLRGGVLSGAGGHLSVILTERQNPLNWPQFEALLVGLQGAETSELSVFHPAVSLAQTVMDVADPLNLAATNQRSVLMTEGINPDGGGADTYAPRHAIEAHALALRLPSQQPAVLAGAEYVALGPPPVSIPDGGLSGNRADGGASGVLAQWPVAPNRDGHFVIFAVPAARDQAAQFCRNLADEAAGRVPAP